MKDHPLARAGLDSQEEESILLKRCRAGEAVAQGELVARYQDRVYNTCLRMCGNPADAEDYTQEAMIKALESLHRFDGRSRFYTWLYRIAVNLVLSGRRRASTVRMRGLDEGGRWAQLESADAPTAMQAARREEHRLVLAAMEELDADARAIVVLRDVESLDYAEIAEVLNIAPGTVKSRLHRARMALREKLLPMLSATEQP
jgi:RNA polymerase sigma-70 factor (ECF subfamily)